MTFTSIDACYYCNHKHHCRRSKAECQHLYLKDEREFKKIQQARRYPIIIGVILLALFSALTIKGQNVGYTIIDAGVYIAFTLILLIAALKGDSNAKDYDRKSQRDGRRNRTDLQDERHYSGW